jgi:superfamily II DNA or RNA helicase
MNMNSFILETNSWDNFQTKLLDLNKKQKGDAFELLSKLYFKINPVYNFYDEVWMLSEVPQKELEYLELPSQDLGIDLIAKSGNEYHAIQCKYHSDKTQSVTFKEVSTFISLLESNNKISQGYICSSAFVTSRNFQKLKTKPINLLMSEAWQQLDAEFFKQSHQLLKGERTNINPFQPRKHQKKALEEAIQHFKVGDESRGKLIFPCGAGKSLTGFWMTQELESKSTIIAVPSLSLVKQTLEVYLREIVANGKVVKWLCICSDEGIGKNDDVIYYTENLGVPCHTDPVYIENWLHQNRDEVTIIFTTYQSGRIIADISKKLNFTFDTGIFDEAHKTVGSNKKLFSHLLFEENISIDKRIFMTATERFYAGSKDDIISMDDEDIYGATFAQMSFKEAIEIGLLTDYKVITIDVQKSEISEFIKENNLVQLNDKWKKETEARSLASMLALRKAMKQFNIKNAVSFHSSIEKAVRNKELQQYITDTYNYQPIDTFTVSGKIPTTKRNDIVQEFAKSPKALITNARCLTEGVDIPNIDCIVFADPRKSKVDIVQALGRALRKKEGKDWGYVILPVVYDDETHEIDNDNFNEILAIVRGLASNDERIVEYFKDKNQGNQVNGEMVEQFNFEVFSDYINESELTKQLQIKLWDKLAKLNWMPFEEAKAYVRNLGLKNQAEYWKFHNENNLPKNLPYSPYQVYKNEGWISYPDFLGYDSLFRDLWDYNKSKKYIKKFYFKSQKEFYKYAKSNKLPSQIPLRPDSAYKNKGWKGWGDFLATGSVANQNKKYKSFSEAREFTRNLKLKSNSEWKKYCDENLIPIDIPKYPNQTYKDKGWKGIGDWLGTGKVAAQHRTFLSFEQARDYVIRLNLKSSTEWREYCKTEGFPNNIPKKPSQTYEGKGWKGMGDWLATNRVATQDRKYMPFNESREYARSLSLKNWDEWRLIKGLPKDIPRQPQDVYKNDGWVNWGDWLGTFSVGRHNRSFLSFEEARKYVRTLRLKSSSEWREYSKTKRPNNIPGNPRKIYKSDWKDIKDWLGYNERKSTAKEYTSFKISKEFCLNKRFNSGNEYKQYLRDKGWKGCPIF